MSDEQRTGRKGIPWWIWIGLAVAVIVGLIFALTARGGAVEEVSLGESGGVTVAASATTAT